MGFLLIKVGKDKSNDFCIDQPKVEQQHLELFVDVEGNTYLTDLKTTYGTFVNGKRVEGSIALHKGDKVVIANEIDFDWQRTITYVGKNSFDIGSDKKNKIVIHSDDIDPFHVQIFKDTKGNIFINDLKSVNGTFINDYRIHDVAVIQHGDKLKLGKTNYNWEELFKTGNFPIISESSVKKNAKTPDMEHTFVDNRVNMEEKKSAKNTTSKKSQSPSKEITWRKIGIVAIVLLILMIWFRMLI